MRLKGTTKLLTWLDISIIPPPVEEGNSSFAAVPRCTATYSGRIVKWDEAVERGPSLMPERLAWDADPPVLPDENGSYEHAVAMPGVYKAH
jgi:hypothetical protein